MSGPTVTLTVPVESTRSLHPSSPPSLHSTPDLANTRSTVTLPIHSRSFSTSSLPNLPAFDVPSFDFDSDFDATLSFSKHRLKDSTNDKPTTVRTEKVMAGSESRPGKTGKKRAMFSRPQSWMPLGRSSIDLGGGAGETTADRHDGTKDASRSDLLSPNPPEKPRNVSDSIASLAKRSWIPTSRSPSPAKKDELEITPDARTPRGRSASNSSIMKLRRSSRKRPASPTGSDSGKSTDSRGKLSTYFNKMKQRPQNMLAKSKLQADFDSPASSTASIAPPSTDTRRSHASETSNSTYPEDTAAASRRPQFRDPLWVAFKGLETDYHKLQSRSTTGLRMNLVRSTLVPFLKKYATHPSNKILHYEDLERRAAILNKWWNGLLEVLDGRIQQPVSGVDRPILLDAMAALMMRPEWRQCTTSFTPLVERKPAEHLRRRSQTISGQSSTSVDSTDSAYIAESAGHNVRTMFVTNLVTQMAIVVEKLSIRHAPLSLVNFAGKACAYAFFFAPGIADVLVRLWSLTPATIRRVVDELGLSRYSKGDSDDIATLFPPCVGSLIWTSVRSMTASLKRAASLPLTAAKIPWHGPWVSRWRGRDTDLFFIFCKYYYLLAQEFLPSDLPLIEKARAPGFVLVNAQILSVLDSTIHRQAAVEAMMGPPLADAVHGTDASLMALPAAPNIMKGMNENRLIVLLKDFLSATSILSTDARHTFAESFMVIMKASAKRTSQFDHNACFTICDFLEESLVAYDSVVDAQRLDTVYVDWTFWFEVWKKIMESNNTMSEIRVLALIFSIWDAISSDQSRKESFCLDWLLTEEVFSKLFNNWCPMVRAYYMRLLCWRICRDAGSANDSDAKIFLAASTRLKTVWSHYLWLKQTAEQQSTFPPSTAPSFPTPGKRFMIIRTELPAEQPGLIAGFDSFTSSRSSQPDPTTCPATDFESMDTPDAGPSSPQRKKWGLFGKVLSFTNNTTVDNDLEAVRRETAASRARPALPPKGSSTAISPTTSDTGSTGSSPTYEASQFVFRFTLSWNAAGTMSPPERVLTRPRLPGPAQSCVAWKSHHGSPLLPAAGPPAPTRAVSGSPNQGLVDSARNANPSEVAPSPRHISMTSDRPNSSSSLGSFEQSSDDQSSQSPKAPTSPVSPTQEPIVKPVEPRGVFAAGVKYAGRALAEWSLVVAECNSFVERRREEGVLGLSDIEVPSLGVEGFRKLG